MRSGKQISISWYAVVDFITASFAWSCFFLIRKWLLHQQIFENGKLQVDTKFWLGILFIPLGWLILYSLVGTYRHLYKKSRLFEFTATFICSILGCTFLFFAFLLDDDGPGVGANGSRNDHGHERRGGGGGEFRPDYDTGE